MAKHEVSEGLPLEGSQRKLAPACALRGQLDPVRASSTFRLPRSASIAALCMLMGGCSSSSTNPPTGEGGANGTAGASPSVSGGRSGEAAGSSNQDPHTGGGGAHQGNSGGSTASSAGNESNAAGKRNGD